MRDNIMHVACLYGSLTKVWLCNKSDKRRQILITITNLSGKRSSKRRFRIRSLYALYGQQKEEKKMKKETEEKRRRGEKKMFKNSNFSFYRHSEDCRKRFQVNHDYKRSERKKKIEAKRPNNRKCIWIKSCSKWNFFALSIVYCRNHRVAEFCYVTITGHTLHFRFSGHRRTECEGWNEKEIFFFFPRHIDELHYYYYFERKQTKID